VAITNARILAVDQTHVTFRWKDRGSDSWQGNDDRREAVEGLEDRVGRGVPGDGCIVPGPSEKETAEPFTRLAPSVRLDGAR